MFLPIAKSSNHSLIPMVLVGLLSSFVQAEEPVVDQKTETKTRPQIEVVFVLDTTGSMGGLIQSAKDKIWSIANELVNTEPTPQIKFGLIGFRDRGDQYITQITDLTDDLDNIHTKLMAFAAAGGGDGPESVNQALYESVSKINWTNKREVLKIVFLVGDAPPHMDYQDEKQYPEICQIAVKNDLIINTIQCGNQSQTTVVWQEIARKSEGSFAAIQQSGGTVAIATPFDADIAKINSEINSTVVGYGTASQQMDVARKIASNEKASFEAKADRIAFMSKMPMSVGGGGGGFGGGGRVVGGQNDLVALLIDKEIEFKEVEVDKLPADLKSLGEKERQAEIQKRIDRRQTNRTKVDQLIKQRTDYIEKEKQRLEKEGINDSFDAKVKAMIRKQAATRGIEYQDNKK